LLTQDEGRIEILIQSNNGIQVPAYIATRKLQLDNSVTICAVITDLTERKAAEEELSKYRDHLEELVIQRTLELEKTNQSLKKEIEERKKIEKELQHRTIEAESANKELESFSYSVSHDLRAPLRVMDGFSEAIFLDYGDKLDEQGQDLLIRIRKASQKMSQLIDDTLKLSRVSRSDMNIEQIDLSEMAKSIASELKATQPERQVKFNIQPEVKTYGDRQLVRMALMNLMENSWKFTGRRRQARIDFGASEQDGKLVAFVKDNGDGFDMKYADKIFRPFSRLHSEKDFPGTGIGLATVQRIIHRHGGKIWPEAQKGKGVTFYFTLGE
jgi:light-regulated signal transduction histidine kinase (bacteriophytochrome)